MPSLRSSGTVDDAERRVADVRDAVEVRRPSACDRVTSGTAAAGQPSASRPAAASVCLCGVDDHDRVGLDAVGHLGELAR